MTDADEALAQLDQPQRVYVLAVRRADLEYHQAVKTAAVKRQLAVNEALEACEIALRVADDTKDAR